MVRLDKEINKLLYQLLYKSNCSQNVFEAVACFGNNQWTFEQMMNEMKKEFFDLKAFCDNRNIDFEKIKIGE